MLSDSHRYPALLPFVFLSAGILLSRSQFAVHIAVFGLLLALLFRKTTLYAVVFVAIGIILMRIHDRRPLEGYVGKTVRLHLVVKSSSIASVDSVMTANGMEKFRCTVGISPPIFDRGTAIDAIGFVAETDNPYYLGNGVHHTFDIYHINKIVPPKSIGNTVRTTIRSEIESHVRDSLTAGLLAAFFLGERSGVPYRVRDSFRKAGIYHLFAISGLHVGILFTIFFLLFRFIRISKSAAAIAAGAVLSLYSLMVGLSPSILRAVVMAWAFIIAFVSGRRTYPINTLAFAGLVTLFINPFYIHHLGFQLSYLATFGILLFAPLYTRLKWRWLTTPLAASISAMAFTSPLLAHTFGYFSIVSPLASLIGGILLWVSLAELIAGLVTGFEPFYLIAQLSAALLIWTAKIFGNLPISVAKIRPGSAFLVAWYVILTAIGIKLRISSTHSGRVPGK